MDPKRPTPGLIIIKMTRLTDKERILKAAREKQVIKYQGAPIRLSSDSQKKYFRTEGSGLKYTR